MKILFPKASKINDKSMNEYDKRIVERFPKRVKILGIFNRPKMVITEAIT